jgi:release factor glutamine methyltransferase
MGTSHPPTRRAVLEGIAAELEAAGIESSRLEAERLICHALRIRRHELSLSLAERIRATEALALARTVVRRLAREPLQHIEGTVEFRDLVLRADRRALIPRPETEQLVEIISAWTRAKAAAGTTEVRRVPRPGQRSVTGRPVSLALDVGTGGGAIALSLVQEGIATRVVALDSSLAALEQARENREALGFEDTVDLRRVERSIWETTRPHEQFDLIVSNPPYVRSGAIPELAPEVRDHEPREALDGGREGLDAIREIVRGGRERLREEGALFLEIGADQGPAARDLLKPERGWRGVEIRRDLAGKERFVIATP